jgi:GNAT superfamily N-acetyltransferase
MKPTFRIRPATASDLPHLPALESASATRFAPYGLADVYSTVVTPFESLEEGLAAGRLWVATDGDGEIVGFAAAAVVGGNAHLDEVDVHPDHGQRGIGTALVETVCTWARASGFTAITLTTLHDVPWNAPFYERLGFRVLREHELTDDLRTLFASDAERGLPVANRVAMRREL